MSSGSTNLPNDSFIIHKLFHRNLSSSISIVHSSRKAKHHLVRIALTEKIFTKRFKLTQDFSFSWHLAKWARSKIDVTHKFSAHPIKVSACMRARLALQKLLFHYKWRKKYSTLCICRTYFSIALHICLLPYIQVNVLLHCFPTSFIGKML